MTVGSEIAEHVVEFRYEVMVEEEDLYFDEEESRWRLKPEAKEKAFEMFAEGATDDEGGEWYPRYAVLCQKEFMAGQICELERDHDGSHH